jgi:two-component system LytT family sensor kinase
MRLSPPVKKLFGIALFTSPVIGLLLITPVFIFHTYIKAIYAEAAAEITALVFLVWCVNILLSLPASKSKAAGWVYLLLSYSFSIVFVPVFQMTFYPMVKENDPHQTFHFHVIIFFSVNTVILIIKDLVLTRSKNSMIELENSRLKVKNLEAANERLKQQIHPHFLFNSLSTLKSLIVTSSANAEDYLIKLSGFLRNSISSNTLHTNIISAELEACIDYLDMQKIRFGEALIVEVDIPAAQQNAYWLPAFSLQILAENAIKHNALTIEAPLRISITLQQNIITVTNNIQPKPVTEQSAGTGLANLNERFNILSGEGITIQKTDNTFTVRLKVFDNENCNNRG